MDDIKNAQVIGYELFKYERPKIFKMLDKNIPFITIPSKHRNTKKRKKGK